MTVRDGYQVANLPITSSPNVTVWAPTIGIATLGSYIDGYNDGFAAQPSSVGGAITVSPNESAMLSRNSAITIRVVADPFAGSFRRVLISATYGGSAVEELIHTGIAFSQQYTGGVNSRQVITNGYQFTILRLGGWRGSSVTIRVAAIDVHGSITQKTVAMPEATYTWQIAGHRGNVTPFVGAR